MLFGANYYHHSKKFFPISWREDDQISNVKMMSQARITLKMALKYRFGKKYVRSEFRDNPIENYTAKEIN